MGIEYRIRNNIVKEIDFSLELTNKTDDRVDRTPTKFSQVQGQSIFVNKTEL